MESSLRSRANSKEFETVKTPTVRSGKFISKTPILFLPSTNNAHYLLLDELRKLDLAPASVHLADFMSKIDIRGKSEAENLPEVLKQLRNLEKSSEIKAAIGTKINTLVRNRRKWSSKSVRKGKKFIDSMGEDGAKTTADKILKLLIARNIK